MATKLHQLLAVLDDRKRTAMEILNETSNTFRNKKDHFEGVQRVYSKKFEDGEDYQTERKSIITTVAQRLAYTIKHWKTYTDVRIQIEETNTSNTAKAEVVINDISFGEFGATTLLAMEKNLTQFIEVLRHTPTLDPSIEWELNSDINNQYISKFPEEQKRTSKKAKPIILYDATKEHPAQVQMATYDEVIGSWEITRQSGKITSGEKALMLGRAEELLIATKKARTKANECGVVPVKSDKFFNYITKGKV